MPKSEKTRPFFVSCDDDGLSGEYWTAKRDVPVMVYVWDDDVGDAVEYLKEWKGKHVKEPWLRFDGIGLEDPDDFIDDTVFFDGKEKGWLLEFPEEEWEYRLRKEHDRDFSRTVYMWKHGEMRAGISIDDELGDGRGRAVFFHAIGQDIPVAYYTVVKPKQKIRNETLATKNDV